MCNGGEAERGSATVSVGAACDSDSGVCEQITRVNLSRLATHVAKGMPTERLVYQCATVRVGAPGAALGSLVGEHSVL